MLSFFILFSIIDKLPHRLELVKEVCYELSKDRDEKVVMWVFDSFSTLVSKALVATEENKAEYVSVLTTVFNLNTSIIPIPIFSSATTEWALKECK